MKPKNIILLSVALVCLVAAAFYTVRSDGGKGRNSEDFPDGTFWVCGDCGHGFAMSIDEVYAIKDAARGSTEPGANRIPCPQCGSRNTVRGVRCPNCGHIFARPRGRPVCPKCKEPFPPLFPEAGKK